MGNLVRHPDAICRDASCGIRTDGTIACWGHLLDVEDETARSSVPDGTYTAVSAGWGPACGINARGEVVCWS